ncbi:MAG: family 43 glycosylhydrolase, partial [Acidimicrobiia bacterium]
MSGPTLAPSAPRRELEGPRVRARQLRRRRQRRIAAGAIGVVVVLVSGLLIGVNVRLRLERRDTVDELNLTEADVTVKRQRLERAVTDLQILTEQVSRSEQASGLAQLDLGRIQGNLARAQETLAAQGIQVDALTSCLDGVTTSVQLQRAGNDAAAIDALRNVAGNCNRALVSIGGTGPVYALDFADPFVLPTSEGYYGYATNSGGGDVQVIRSADLREWQVVGNGLSVLPDWAEANLTWAPTVLARGSTFVLYYTVREASTDRQCVSRGVSGTPGGPFVDDSAVPLRCASDGDIDASPFVDR